MVAINRPPVHDAPCSLAMLHGPRHIVIMMAGALLCSECLTAKLDPIQRIQRRFPYLFGTQGRIKGRVQPIGIG